MARAIGAPATVLINGLWCIVGALLFSWRLEALRKLIRPVYVRKGIILSQEVIASPDASHPM